MDPEAASRGHRRSEKRIDSQLGLGLALAVQGTGRALAGHGCLGWAMDAWDRPWM